MDDTEPIDTPAEQQPEQPQQLGGPELPTWDDVGPHLKTLHPDVDQEWLKDEFNKRRDETTKQRKISHAVDFYSDPENAEKLFGPGSPSYIAERLPFYSGVSKLDEMAKLHGAAKAIQSGDANDDAYYVVAQHLAKQQYEAKRTGVGERTLDLATSLPGMLAEWASTSGVGEAAKEGVARGVGGLAGKAIGYAAEGAVRSAGMPATYGALGSGAVGTDEQGNPVAKEGLDLAKGVGKEALKATIQNTIFAASGMFSGKSAPTTSLLYNQDKLVSRVAQSYLGQSALSTAKAVGAGQLNKETLYQLALSDNPAELHKVLTGPDRVQALKELAPEIMVFGTLEATMHAIPLMKQRANELQKQGIKPGSEKMEAKLVDYAEEVRKLPPPEPPETAPASPETPQTGPEAPQPAQEAPKPAETPQQAPNELPGPKVMHEAAPAFEKAFGDKATVTPSGEFKATVGEGRSARDVYIAEGSKPNTVRVDFGYSDAERGGVKINPETGKAEFPKETEKGSLELFRGLRTFLKENKGAGHDIEFVAIGGRESKYGRLLENAGYEQVAGPKGAGNELRTWRPVAEKAPETAKAPEPEHFSHVPKEEFPELGKALAGKKGIKNAAELVKALRDQKIPEHFIQTMSEGDKASREPAPAAEPQRAATYEPTITEPEGPPSATLADAGQPGEEIPAPPQAPQPPVDRLARLRAAQQKVGPQAPHYSGPEGPQPAPTPEEAMRQRFVRGDPISLDEVFKAKNLSSMEQQVIRAQLDGRSFAEIAESMVNPKTGRPYTRQRAEQIASAAMQKMGVSKSIAEAVHEQERLARAEDMARKGKLVRSGDLHADPEEVAKRGQEALDDTEKQAADLDALAEQIIEESKDGELSPDRLAFFEREAKRITEAKSAGDEEPGRPAQEIPDAGQQPAPVGREAPGSVPPSEAPAPDQAAPRQASEWDTEGTTAPSNPEAAGNKLGFGERSRRAKVEKNNPEIFKEIEDLGVSKDDVHRMAYELYSVDKKAVEDHNAVLSEAYKTGKEWGINPQLIAKSEDSASIPHLDEVAASGVFRDREMLIHKDELPVEALYRILKDRRQTAEKQEAYYEKALDYYREMKEASRITPEELADENARLKQKGIAPLADESIEQAEAEGRNAGENGSGQTSEGDVSGQDDSFDFGFNVDPQIQKIVGDFIQDDAGSVDLDVLKKYGQEKYRQITGSMKGIRAGLAELAGKMAPRTSGLNRDAGEALTRYNAVGTFIREATPYYIDKVLGKGATAEFRNFVGSVMTERRLRFMKNVFMQEATDASNEAYDARLRASLAKDPKVKAGWLMEAKQKAMQATEAIKAKNEVVSVVGQKESPLKSEADYQAGLANPKIKETIARFNKEIVPLMEDNYRRAQGMEDTDPIIAKTQIPNEPINLKAIREGEETPTTVFTGEGGRGNLKNVKLNKLGFTYKAMGDAPAYDIDLGAIIENSLGKGFSNAAKAEAVRTAVEKGIGQWGKRGEKMDGYHEIPEVRPPRGTQDNLKGEGSLFIHDDAYPEWRKAFAVDEPARFGPLSAVSDLMTKSALMSTVEGAYHTKNNLTMLMKPGVSPIDFIKNTMDVIRGSESAKQQIMDLAQIGAQKDGVSAGPTNPLNLMKWSSRFLHGINDIMRLTADDAFSRLAKQGRVEDTETNRRDFVNQLGNYNKRAQASIVTLLRDIGLGPFATAGTNYYMQGLKSVTMDPGAKATSTAHAVGLRAEMLAKTASVLAATALANYMIWKRPDGDESTPLGAIKVGTDDQGRTAHFDLTNLTGLTRGLRETGLLSLLEGTRHGESSGKIVDRATENAVSALMHPGFGPIAQFAETAYTGKDSFGRNLAQPAGAGESQHWQNLKAALKNANPLIAVGTGSDQPDRETTTGEKIGKLLGPFGVHYSGPRKPQDVLNFHEAYHAELDSFSKDRKAALQLGKSAKEPRWLPILQETSTQLNTLEKRFHAPDASPERKQEIRQRQETLAKSALEKMKRLKGQ